MPTVRNCRTVDSFIDAVHHKDITPMQEPALLQKLEWASMVSADRESGLVWTLKELRFASLWGEKKQEELDGKDASLAKVREELEEAQGQLKELRAQSEASAASAAQALGQLQQKSDATAASSAQAERAAEAESTAKAKLAESEHELKALKKQVEKLTQDLDASKGQVNRLREEQAAAAKAKDAKAKEAKTDSKETTMAKELAAAQAEAAAARAAQREAEAAAQAARRRRQEIENTLAAERKTLAERERSLREPAPLEEGCPSPAAASQDKGSKGSGKVEAPQPRRRAEAKADPAAKRADLEAKALAGTAGPKSKGSRAAAREVNRSAAVGKLSHLKRSMGQVHILTWAFGAAIFFQVCLVVSWYTS